MKYVFFIFIFYLLILCTLDFSLVVIKTIVETHCVIIHSKPQTENNHQLVMDAVYSYKDNTIKRNILLIPR